MSAEKFLPLLLCVYLIFNTRDWFANNYVDYVCEISCLAATERPCCQYKRKEKERTKKEEEKIL
jgi:hypothetical protein